MKSKLNQSSLLTQSFTVAAAALLVAHSAQADSGTWNVDTNANWNTSTTAPWLNGIVAEGSGFTANFTNDITATRTVTLTAPLTIGNLVFGDANTATAASWTLAGAAANVLTLAGATPTITVNALGAGAIARVDAVMGGTAGLNKAGTGILLVVGANTYTGGTTISEGSLRAAANSALSSGAVTVLAGASLQLQNSVTHGNTINLNGSGSSPANRALTLIGGAPILSGSVNVQSNSTITMGSAANASVDISGGLNLGANTLTVEGSRPLTLGGAISGTGTLNLANSGGTTTITNNNSATYSGQVNVSRGTLAVGHNGALGSGAILFGVDGFSSGIQSTNTTTRTLANVVSLTGNTGSTYTFGSTTGTANGDLTFTSAIDIDLGATSKRLLVHNRTEFNAGFTGTGTTGITMETGTGTLVLNGTSTYLGATTVNAGTLLVNGTLGSASVVTVNTGGTLGGHDGTVGATTIAAGGTLAPGSTIGTMNFSQLTLGGIANFEIDPTLALGLNADRANVTSGLIYGGTLNVIYGGASSNFTNGMLFNLFDANSITGSFSELNLPTLTGGLSWQNDLATNGSITVIPEPNTAALLGCLGMLCLLRRRATH